MTTINGYQQTSEGVRQSIESMDDMTSNCLHEFLRHSATACNKNNIHYVESN